MIAEALRVRAMTPLDVDAVLALDRAIEEAPHWRREDYLACLETVPSLTLRRIGLVAEWNGSFAGFAVVRCLTLGGDNEAELESSVVCSELRRAGVGATLLAAIIDAAKEDGAKRLDLEVRVSNDAAVGLYRRAGFTESGRRRAYYHDPEEDAVLMSTTL